jgi:hypothetical protein
MAVSGTYIVTYSATDVDGNTGTADRTVIVLSGWPQQQKIQATDKQGGDLFGWSVSISEDGNTAIVGAPDEDTDVSAAGAAYIFTWSETSSSWSEQQKIQASDKQQGDYFGSSVAISDDGNTVIVGAQYEDAVVGSNTIWGAGAAYIFTWSETSSSWSEQQKIQASDKQMNAYFGESVAISGDGNTAIVGARQEDPGGTTDAGSAYIFTKIVSNFGFISWSEQQKIQASDKQGSDWFGGSVAISDDGNTAIVGARREDPGGTTDAGATYIFTRSGTSWSEQQKIQASDKQGGDLFGGFVAISGDGNTAIVGAANEDTGGSNAGAAYTYRYIF